MSPVVPQRQTGHVDAGGVVVGVLVVAGALVVVGTGALVVVVGATVVGFAVVDA